MKSKKIFESSGYELFFSSNPSHVVILNVILMNVNFEQCEAINTKWSIAKYFYSPVVTKSPPNLQKVPKS